MQHSWSPSCYLIVVSTFFNNPNNVSNQSSPFYLLSNLQALSWLYLSIINYTRLSSHHNAVCCEPCVVKQLPVLGVASEALYGNNDPRFNCSHLCVQVCVQVHTSVLEFSPRESELSWVGSTSRFVLSLITLVLFLLKDVLI